MCQDTSKQKDMTEPKLVKIQGASRGGESELSGQWRPTRQVAVQPQIIDMVALADKLEGEGGEVQGKFTWQD